MIHDREFKKSFFNMYFFNQDIFYKNASKHLKFGGPTDKGNKQGKVSQILHSGFNFYFMKSRNKS